MQSMLAETCDDECSTVNITTKADIEGLLRPGTEHVVIIKFGAAWCAPCKQYADAMSKMVKDLRAIYPALQMGIVDADEAPEVFTEYEITAMPTMLVYKGAEICVKVKRSEMEEMEALKDSLKMLVPKPPLVLDEDF